MLFHILIKVALFGLGVIVGNTLSMLWTPKCAGMCPTCPPVSLPLPCTCHAREIGKGPNIFRPPFNSASLWIYKKQETRTYTL
jgi:hypothetical protein